MLRVAWSGITGPQLQRNTAWWAVFGGLVAYLAWQGFALVISTLVFLGRASDRCLVGPECDLLGGTSPAFVGFLALGAAALSVALLPTLAKLTLAFWQQKYWTGMALRIVGLATAVAGLLGFLVYGLVWAGIGAWIAFWSRRLSLAPGRPAGQPRGQPRPDPDVLEGERV